MKKLHLLILAMVLLLSVVGCQPAAPTSAPASGGNESGVPQPPSKKIAWVASNIANEFTTGMADNAVAVGKDHGWEVTVFNPNSDLSKQISQIENAATQGYAGIIFDPVAFDGMNAVVQSVMENYDIPVITLHGSVSPEAQELLTAYVAVDLVKGGELKMEQVVKDLGGKGDIAIMTGTEGQTSALLVTQGYENVLAKYPDINVVFKGAGNWNADDATPLAENWLSSGKHLDAIVCNNDGMALGVRAVLKAAGLTNQIKLYGLDATNEARVAVRDGSFDASIWVDSYAEFVEAFNIIDAYYAGEPFEEQVMVAPSLVTAENIDELFPNDD